MMVGSQSASPHYFQLIWLVRITAEKTVRRLKDNNKLYLEPWMVLSLFMVFCESIHTPFFTLSVLQHTLQLDQDFVRWFILKLCINYKTQCFKCSFKNPELKSLACIYWVSSFHESLVCDLLAAFPATGP